MNAENRKVEITTFSAEETHALGKRIGQILTTGMVLTLTGDLGSGKTLFVQGLAEGLNIPETYYVTSPTFTIINEYPGRLPLFHIDLYRLSGSQAAEDIGFHEILNPESVIAIEWPEIIASELPEDSISLCFEILDDTTRKISIITYGLEGKSVIERLDVSL